MALTRIRILLVTAIGVCLAAIAGGVFDEMQSALFVAPVVVGAAALAVRSRSGSIRAIVALVACTIGVLTSVWVAGGTAGDAGSSVVRGPRRLLTTEWPSPSDPTIVGAIALLLALATALAADAAGRERLHLTPFIPLLVALGVLLALGAPVQPDAWLFVALAGTGILLVLARPGDTLPGRTRTVLAERTLAVSAGAIVVVAVATSATLAWADRANPRRTEDAEVTAALVDPVEAMVALREAEPQFDMYELTDRSTLIGQSLPSRWRVAALDTYDGQRWTPKVTMRPIGGRLGLPSPSTAGGAPPIRYDLRLGENALDLLPFPGRPISVSADVQTDLDRVIVRLAERPTGVTDLQIVSEVAPSASAASIAAVGTRQVDDIAGGFSELAGNLAGDGTVIEQLRRLEETMSTEWQLDPSAPGGGQQLALLDRFVTDTRRGTEEQFATAFVLLARSLGYDARIATGFVVPPEELANPLALRSSHAAVWPEVRLDDVGWLAFDPAPARTTTDEDEPPPPPEAQSPTAAQPPIVPPAETGDEDDETVVDVTDDDSRWGAVTTWLGRAATVGGLTLLPVAVVIGAIVLAKWRRRRRRLRTPDPAERIRGAWANATDSLVDAGLTIAPAWTDDRIAKHAMTVAPTAPHETRRLAAMSTAMTFGGTGDGWRLVDDAVSTSGAIDTAIRADRTRWQRLRWRLSLRSLRRSTRSPVVT